MLKLVHTFHKVAIVVDIECHNKAAAVVKHGLGIFCCEDNLVHRIAVCFRAWHFHRTTWINWLRRRWSADWCFLLARTSNEDRKQQGITFILLDLRTLGIEIRPIILVDGLHETKMVYYKDVRVPMENTVGEVGKGYGIGKYLLAHGLMSGGSLGPHKKLLIQLKSIAADGETSGFCA